MGCAGSKPPNSVTPSADASADTQPSHRAQRRVSVLIDQNYALDFDRVINDEVGIRALLKFAKSEFNDEMVR